MVTHTFFSVISLFLDKDCKMTILCYQGTTRQDKTLLETIKANWLSERYVWIRTVILSLFHIFKVILEVMNDVIIQTWCMHVIINRLKMLCHSGNPNYQCIDVKSRILIHWHGTLGNVFYEPTNQMTTFDWHSASTRCIGTIWIHTTSLTLSHTQTLSDASAADTFLKTLW